MKSSSKKLTSARPRMKTLPMSGHFLLAAHCYRQLLLVLPRPSTTFPKSSIIDDDDYFDPQRRRPPGHTEEGFRPGGGGGGLKIKTTRWFRNNRCWMSHFSPAAALVRGQVGSKYTYLNRWAAAAGLRCFPMNHLHHHPRVTHSLWGFGFSRAPMFCCAMSFLELGSRLSIDADWISPCRAIFFFLVVFYLTFSKSPVLSYDYDYDYDED